MESKGADSNISAIYDQRADVYLQKVDYSDWVSDAWPFVRITAPDWNATHVEGDEIVFEGEATDYEDGDLAPESLTWRSDKDGFLGNGNPISASRLSVGHHVVTLYASDSSGKEITSEVELDVVVAP